MVYYLKTAHEYGKKHQPLASRENLLPELRVGESSPSICHPTMPMVAMRLCIVWACSIISSTISLTGMIFLGMPIACETEIVPAFKSPVLYIFLAASPET